MAQDEVELGVIVTCNGSIIGSGERVSCYTPTFFGADAQVVDFEGGSTSPGLVSFGSPLGLQHIDLEPSTLGPQEGAASYWFNKVKEVSVINSIVSDLPSLCFFRVRYHLLWKPTVPISS